MRKFIFLPPLFFVLSFCSCIGSTANTYPKGIVFPLARDGRILYQGEIVDLIQREEDHLYLATEKGFVYGIDGRERNIAWSFQAPDELASPPYLGENRIYVGDKNSTLYCLDKQGKLSWKKNIEEIITSGVMEHQGRVYLGTEKGNLWALSVEGGNTVWKFQAEGAIHSTPVMAQGMIIFGCDDHLLYFLDEQGTAVERFETGGKIRSSPLVDGNCVYFVSEDQYFYCLDVESRRKEWAAKIGCITQNIPVTDGKRILFLCLNGILYCLNKHNGTVLWWEAVPARSFYRLAVIEERVIVSALSSLLFCYDIRTGERVGMFDAGQVVQSNPLWFEPYLLVNVYDFRKQEGSLIYLKKVISLTLSSSLQPPQYTGQEVVFSASTEGFYKPEYKFFLSRLTEVEFNTSLLLFFTRWEKKTVQEKSARDSWLWFPEQPGVYVVEVEAVDAKQSREAVIPFVVEKEKPQASIIPSRKSPQLVEEEIDFHARAAGLVMPEFEFSLSRLTEVEFNTSLLLFYTRWEKKTVQQKSEKNSWSWTPEAAGVYVVKARAVSEKEEAEAVISFVVMKEMDEHATNLVMFMIYWIKIFTGL